MVTWIIVIVVVVALIFWGVGIYNRLIRMRNEVNNAWAQIDVQLQRRHDLIPNLVECVKEYMGYERETLEKVISARSQAMEARQEVNDKGGPTEASLGALAGAEGVLQGALGKIFALAENYPDLKASQNMRSLQEELASTENRVAFARQAYNDAAMGYNTSQQIFPANLVAKALGHHPVDLYQAEEGATAAPKISFK